MVSPFRFQRRVEFRDTDAAGIVHFSVFFNYMEEAEHALLRELGSNVLMSDDEGEFSFPRVAVNCEYSSPLQFGDVVDLDVAVERIGTSSVTYAFEFSNGGGPIAHGTVTAVCCRLADGKKPKAIPIPPDVRSQLEQLQ
jgi:4-hydroxybenzoyl-CoA thioesterase/acyl-CoA thioester hydrolase